MRMLAVVLALIVSSAIAAEELHVGVATLDITPPIGYRLCGYFSERQSTGVHDPLHAKAIYLRQGKTSAAWIFCDLIGPAGEITERTREEIRKRCDVPANHVLIHGTHSHTGPLFFGALREHFHAQAKEKNAGVDPFEKVDYAALLVERCAAAVDQAKAAAKPALVRETVGEERTLSFNRRFQLKNGSVKFNPGRFNPEIARVLGPIDPEVGVLSFSPADGGKPFAGLTVFALHLDTVGGTEYSADYPLYLEQTLRSELGDTFTSLFGNGTCGDINHIDVANEQPQKGQEMAKHIGVRLGATVLKTMASLRKIDEPSLAVASSVITVPAQQYSPERVAEAKKGIFLVGTKQSTFLEQVEACKIVDLDRRGGGAFLPIEVQAFRLSKDVAVVALPGEVFVEIGMWIKMNSPFKTTLVVELCNDTPAYIPTRKAFAEGSYETVNSRIQAGGGEMMAREAVRLLRGLAK